MIDEQISRYCSNCQTSLLGRYCHNCGQKISVESDRRFPHLLALFFSELTSLDGRFWRTIRGLFRPGFLSQQYLSGRRAAYLTPVSVFLLVNVVYFFAPALNDFDLPFSDHLSGRLLVRLFADEPMSSERRARLEAATGQLHSAWTTDWIERKLAERRAKDPNYSLKQLGQRFDAKSAEISKLLIIIHTPFLALALLLMFRANALFYAEHFVVALHLFAAILLAIQCLFPLMAILPSGVPWIEKLIVFLLPCAVLVYLAFGLRRVYQRHWFYSAIAAIGLLFALLFANIVIYRSLQFAIVFSFS